jgi:hypothetical protein
MYWTLVGWSNHLMNWSHILRCVLQFVRVLWNINNCRTCSYTSLHKLFYVFVFVKFVSDIIISNLSDAGPKPLPK